MQSKENEKIEILSLKYREKMSNGVPARFGTKDRQRSKCIRKKNNFHKKLLTFEREICLSHVELTPVWYANGQFFSASPSLSLGIKIFARLSISHLSISLVVN